jgi:hypothetical protein
MALRFHIGVGDLEPIKRYLPIKDGKTDDHDIIVTGGCEETPSAGWEGWIAK